MPRSLKKGPFVDDHLIKKVDVLNESGEKKSNSNVVPSVHHCARHGRPHDGCTRWP
jgi:ribosomal protein S19